MEPSQLINYPIFIRMCQFSQDTFWKFLFENLAYGTTPQNMFITADSLVYKIKGNYHNFYYNEYPTPEIMYTHLMTFLTEKCNVLSTAEHYKKRLAFNESLKNHYTDWASIRKKGIKDYMIETYVIRVREKYNLSFFQMKELLSSITLGFQFKFITNKDIEYDNVKKCIVSIKNVHTKYTILHLANMSKFLEIC